MTSTSHLAVGMLAAKEGVEGKEGRRFTAFGLIEMIERAKAFRVCFAMAE